jgi:hypothetical protein
VISLDAVIQANNDQISTDMADEMVILNLQDGVYYGLNQVGTFVWKMLQAPVPVRQICDAVVNEYEVDPERCQKDILALLQDLQSHGLIKVSNGAAA